MKSKETLAIWHRCVRERDMSNLEKILDDEVVFYSPILFKPQEGKFLTGLYLTGASMVFGQESFKYVKEVVNDQYFMLEFESQVEDVFINGIDIITLNEEGKIIEFKVMIRPYKAVDKLKEKMAIVLAQMKG